MTGDGHVATLQLFGPGLVKGGTNFHDDVPDDVVACGLLLQVSIFDQVRYRCVYCWPERVARPALIWKGHILMDCGTSELQAANGRSRMILQFAG